MSDVGRDASARAKDNDSIAQWPERGKVQGSADASEQVQSTRLDLGADLWTTPPESCAFARGGFGPRSRDPLFGIRY